MRRLLFCALLLVGCHRTPPRVLHVQVAAGPELRRQTGWRDLVAARLRAVSAIFEPLAVQFVPATVSEWEPDPKQSPEANRRILAGFHDSGNWIELGFYGSRQADGEPGLAVPFDPRVLVFDVPSASEAQQAANLAHELGHLFGAWHPQGGGSVMSLPAGKELDRDAKSCLRLTRSVDLLHGASSLDADTVRRIQKLWTASKDGASSNPFYRFYSGLGLEEISRGLRPQAVEDFTKAAQFGPGLAIAHVDLGNVELASHEYLEAADEMRKALALDPGSSAAMSGLAAALLATGHRDEALQLLAKSVKMNPGDPRLHANLGVVLVGAPGRMKDAIAELREALRIDPGNAAIRHSLDLALAARKQRRK